MKKIMKYGFILAAGVAIFAGCTPKENLDLAGYATSHARVEIADLDVPAATLPLEVVYDAEGKLTLAGDLTHTYVVRLDVPSPKDMTLRLEALHDNIADGAYSIDKTELAIPAGFTVSEPVTVTLTKDAFLGFAEGDLAAKTYEIGVRAVEVRGENVALAENLTDAKVVVDKGAYAVSVSVAEQEGRSKNFNVTYANGAVTPAGPFVYTFHATLDRPAHSDVTLSFATEGLPDAVADQLSLDPATVVIPAGATTSEEITWSLPSDFLLADELPASYSLAVRSTMSTGDPTVSMVEGAGDIAILISKGITAVPSTWDKLATTDWVVSPTNLFDGNIYNYSSGYELTVTVDMLEAKSVIGIAVRPYAGYAGYNATSAEVLVSDDNETWSSAGKFAYGRLSLMCLPLRDTAPFRYAKLLIAEPGGFNISEIEFYTKK